MVRFIHILLLLLNLFPEFSTSSKLIDKAVNISSYYYKHHFATTVVWYRHESEYVNDFLKKFSGTVVLCPLYNNIADTIGSVHEAFGFKQTIFFATNLHQYGIFMSLINDIIRFPILFILVLEKPVNQPSELSAYIETTWNNDQGDLIIISVNAEDDITLSTFIPYGEGICGNYTPVTLRDEDKLFPKKFSNFHFCPIRTALLEYKPYVEIETTNGTITSVSGFDGILLMIIINKLNATFEITSANNHNIYGSYVNGTTTGSINDLATEKADILIPGGTLTHKRYLVTLPSHIYHTIDYRWIGPKQREINHWLNFFIPDKSNFNPILGVALSSFIITAMLIRKCKLQETSGNNQVLFYTFAMCLGQSVKFVTKSSLLNFLFIVWIWCCFIFRIDYQGDLVNGMQEINLEPPFQSVDEAVTRVDGYGGAEIFKELYKDTPLENQFQVIPLPDIAKYIQRIVEGDRLLLGVDLVLVREIQQAIQIIDFQISTTGACFFMRPGWPAANQVNSIIMSLIEAGFIEKLLSKHNIKWKLSKNKDSDPKLKSLSMRMVSTLFYGLAIMWLVCFIVLTIEIVYYNNKLKEQHSLH